MASLRCVFFSVSSIGDGMQSCDVFDRGRAGDQAGTEGSDVLLLISVGQARGIREVLYPPGWVTHIRGRHDPHETLGRLHRPLSYLGPAQHAGDGDLFLEEKTLFVLVDVSEVGQLAGRGTLGNCNATSGNRVTLW